MALVHGILSRRNEVERPNKPSRPVFIWEPMPDLCSPEHISSFKQAIRQVNVVSPNSHELAGYFMGESKSQDQMVAEILEVGIGPGGNGLLVVREGENGCSAWSKRQRVHLRAYHTPVEEAHSKVVDPTGGGNAFLGALAMASTGRVCPQMVKAKQLLAVEDDLTRVPVFDFVVSLVYATVAASFVIEQTGMPTYHVQGDGDESWNGEGFGHRLSVYLCREKAYLIRQLEQ